MALGLPSSLTGLFQGTLLFLLLAIDVFIYYRVRNVPALHAPTGIAARAAAGYEGEGEGKNRGDGLDPPGRARGHEKGDEDD